MHKPKTCYYLVNRPKSSWSQHFDFLKFRLLQDPQQSLVRCFPTRRQRLNQLGKKGFGFLLYYVSVWVNPEFHPASPPPWRLHVKPSWLTGPHPTSRSWRSLRVVLFLLMRRRRSSTKTERPAIRMARSPPTTPAAIMERPELNDTKELVLNMQPANWRNVSQSTAAIVSLTFYPGSQKDQVQNTCKEMKWENKIYIIKIRNTINVTITLSSSFLEISIRSPISSLTIQKVLVAWTSVHK